MDTTHHRHFLDDLLRTLRRMLWPPFWSWLLGWAVYYGLALRAIKAHAAGVTAQRRRRMPVQAVPAEMADLAQTLNQMLERSAGRLLVACRSLLPIWPMSCAP
jgi:two-component system heavy metal sensor histidine kinase CusS